MSILAPPPDLAAALMAAALQAMLDGRDDDARTLLQQAQGGPRAMPRAQTPGGLPFPVLADPPHVPADIQALAEAVEAGLTTVEAGLTTVEAGLTTVKGRATALEARHVTKSGSRDFGAIAANSNAQGTITFTGSPFTAAPHVVVSAWNADRYTVYVASSITTSGFVLTTWNNTAAALQIARAHWIAAGPVNA